MTEEFSIGERVRIVALPAYVKTADPMPMLRPPDVLSVGEEGVVLDRRPGGYWGIRFARGAFLLDSQYLEATTTPAASSAANSSSNESSLPTSESLGQ